MAASNEEIEATQSMREELTAKSRIPGQTKKQ